MAQQANGVPTPSTPLSPGAEAVAAEQVWSSAGERLAAGNYSQKVCACQGTGEAATCGNTNMAGSDPATLQLCMLNTHQLIEQKERELQEYIALHHARIRQVEGELSDVQFQLKLTAGPKKQALELMRRKIETQNQRVVLARKRQEVAKQAFDAADAELQHEEAQKEQLCNELNILVQQSVQAQLDRFAELQSKLEMLSDGVAPRSGSVKSNGATAACNAPSKTSAQAAAVPAAGTPAASPASSAPASQQQPDDADTAAEMAAEAERMAQKRAQQAAARARHVQLQQALGKGRAASAGPAQQQQQQQQQPQKQSSGDGREPQSRQQQAPAATSLPDGRFAGFDA